MYSQGAVKPQYEPDPSSRGILERVAVATGGAVHSETGIEEAVSGVRRALGSGPKAAEGQVRGRDALAPYLALAAFLPLGLLLWRRDR